MQTQSTPDRKGRSRARDQDSLARPREGHNLPTDDGGSGPLPHTTCPFPQYITGGRPSLRVTRQDRKPLHPRRRTKAPNLQHGSLKQRGDPNVHEAQTTSYADRDREGGIWRPAWMLVQEHPFRAGANCCYHSDRLDAYFKKQRNK